MLKSTILEQRRATKRLCIKRLKRGCNIEALQQNLNELAKEFPYNSEYYSTLEKGLIKLHKILKVS